MKPYIKIKNVVIKTSCFLALTVSLIILLCCDNRGKAESIGGEHLTTRKSEVVDDFVDVPEVRFKVTPVRAAEVRLIGGRNTAWYDGVTFADPVQVFRFKVSGTISQVKYKKGSKLLYERVLAKMDTTEHQAKVDELEALVENAEVKLIKASAKLENLQKKLEHGEASTADIKYAETAVAEAEAEVCKRRNKLQDARIDLGHHEIRIQLRGVITELGVAVGDHVEAEEAIATMELRMPCEVTVNVPNILLNHIGVKSRANVRFKKGLRGKYPADVVNIGELSNDPLGTFPVTVRIRNPYPNIKPGMEALVAFRFDYRLNNTHYILPHGAMGKDEQGRHVFVINPTEGESNYGTLERRSVVPSNVSGWGQNVSSGVKNGELIVTANVERLKEGMQVKYK